MYFFSNLVSVIQQVLSNVRRYSVFVCQKWLFFAFLLGISYKNRNAFWQVRFCVVPFSLYLLDNVSEAQSCVTLIQILYLSKKFFRKVKYIYFLLLHKIQRNTKRDFRITAKKLLCAYNFVRKCGICRTYVYTYIYTYMRTHKRTHTHTHIRSENL